MAVTALVARPAISPPAAPVLGTPEHPLLQQARERAEARQLAYAGELAPADAWQLLAQRSAVLVDVRTAEERRFVGYVPDSVHVPWQLGTAMQTNPRFLRELEAKIAKDAPVLMLCRSGARSAAAAAAATRAGFKHVYQVLEGFEGELDEAGHRGSRNGWRLRGLPWLQD